MEFKLRTGELRIVDLQPRDFTYDDNDALNGIVLKTYELDSLRELLCKEESIDLEQLRKDLGLEKESRLNTEVTTTVIAAGVGVGRWINSTINSFYTNNNAWLDDWKLISLHGGIDILVVLKFCWTE